MPAPKWNWKFSSNCESPAWKLNKSNLGFDRHRSSDFPYSRRLTPCLVSRSSHPPITTLPLSTTNGQCPDITGRAYQLTQTSHSCLMSVVWLTRPSSPPMAKGVWEGFPKILSERPSHTTYSAYPHNKVPFIGLCLVPEKVAHSCSETLWLSSNKFPVDCLELCSVLRSKS